MAQDRIIESAVIIGDALVCCLDTTETFSFRLWSGDGELTRFHNCLLSQICSDNKQLELDMSDVSASWLRGAVIPTATYNRLKLAGCFRWSQPELDEIAEAFRTQLRDLREKHEVAMQESRAAVVAAEKIAKEAVADRCVYAANLRSATIGKEHAERQVARLLERIVELEKGWGTPDKKLRGDVESLFEEFSRMMSSHFEAEYAIRKERAAKMEGILAERVQDAVPLSIRAVNALRNDGLHTLGDVMAVTESYLLRIPNFGRKSLNEVKEWCASHGVALASGKKGE